MNFFRSLYGDFFDVDAASRTHHQDGPLRRAIHDDADVTLAGDLCGRSDQHLMDGEALDRHAEDGFRAGFGLGRRLRELHAAGLAPPSGMHLRLHDHFPPQSVGDGARLRGRRCHFAWGDRNAVTPQNVSRLVFVQVHACSVAIVVPASP